MGSLRWRALTAAIVVIAALISLLPSVPGMRDSALRRILPESELNLGLDLKGGIHLTLGVDLDAALKNALAMAGQDIRSETREEKIPLLRPKILGKRQLECMLVNTKYQQQFDELLSARFSQFQIVSTQTLENGRLRYVLEPTAEHIKYLEDLTMDQALKTVRNRVDQFGVAEPDIRKEQGSRIIVQLPGLDDPKRAVDLIGRTAHLEFKLVDMGADLQAALNGVIPVGSEVRKLSRTQSGAGEDSIVLKSDVLLTGEYITDARVQFDSFGRPSVLMRFNARGARIFEEITGANINKRLAIVLDGKVYSAPVIESRISADATISGQFTTEQAHDLAVVLRAGSLPAPVTVLEERSVGPSLGQESIDKGMLAASVGGLLVILFMSVYYGRAGWIASFEVVLDIVLILAGMSVFGATLTLPGIAGIILTIGMAVDANVLIYERIREELRLGNAVSTAIQDGFSRAKITILDANLTTIIAAIILYQFGTGPVRGFAVTLTLGILASMFTAIFVSRIFFDAWLSRRKPGDELSI